MPHSSHFGMTGTTGLAVNVAGPPPVPAVDLLSGPHPSAPPAVPRRVVIVDSPAPSYSSESPTQILAEHLTAGGTAVEVLARVDVLPDVPSAGRPAALPPGPRTSGRIDPHQFELVIGMSGPDGDAAAAARLARRSAVPLLVVVTGLDLPVRENVVRTLSTADRLAVPAESYRQALIAQGVDDARITVLPTWSQSSPSVLDRADARRRLGWPDRAFIAVHSGPMLADCGLEHVVDAAALLGSGCFVALVGSGPHRSVIEARAARVPGAIVPAPMDAERRALTHVAADVLLVTEPGVSSRLTLPLELARCLSAGRPVVATAPPSGTIAAELPRAGGAGLVVPAGEPVALASALTALRADPTHRVSMGLAAISYAESCLRRETVLAHFDDVVNGILNSRPATV